MRFFPADATAPPPPRFAPNIVQGKSYDLADQAAARYFGELMHLLLGASVEVDLSQPWHRPGPVFGDPRLAPYRLGQRSFQAVVLDAYHRRCAISGTRRFEYMQTIVQWLAKLAMLRVPVNRAAQVVWALASPDVGRMLCDVQGWTTDEYAYWLEDTLTIILLAAQ